MRETSESYPLDMSLLAEEVTVSAGVTVRARAGLGNESYVYEPSRLEDELQVVVAQENAQRVLAAQNAGPAVLSHGEF